MDEVQQVLLRSACRDGYEVGVEVGRRVAAAKDNKKATKDIVATAAKDLNDDDNNLMECVEV